MREKIEKNIKIGLKEAQISFPVRPFCFCLFISSASIIYCLANFKRLKKKKRITNFSAKMYVVFSYFTDASHHLVTFSFFYSYLFHLAVSFPCFFLSAATHTKYTFKNIFTSSSCHSHPPPSPRQRNSTPELSTLVFLFHVLLIY